VFEPVKLPAAISVDIQTMRASPREDALMFAAGRVNATSGNVRVKTVALPVEHGGWGLLFESVLLGLVLAPSIAALCLSLAAIGAFLARHPFKLAIGDWRRKRRSPRTTLAERFAGFYFVIAIVALAAVFASRTGGIGFALPLLLATPIALVQLFYDALGRSRALTAELSGAVSMGALATAIVLLGGWPRAAAFGLWAIVVARNVPTILYLRARLKLLHHRPASPRTVVAAHLLAILIVFGFAFLRMAPFMAVVAMLILFCRAVVGFSKGQPVKAAKLGMREIVFGAITVFAVAMGHVAGW
jgi:hypothetical protein